MKDLCSMLQESTGATFTAPAPKRVVLDIHHWDRYDLILYYEGKHLCLELLKAEEHERLGHWTFCEGCRHMDTLTVSAECEIDISFRPAHISVHFCQPSKKGFLKRWIHQMNRVHWSEYEVRPDGLVSVSRPGEERLVG